MRGENKATDHIVEERCPHCMPPAYHGQNRTSGTDDLCLVCYNKGYLYFNKTTGRRVG